MIARIWHGTVLKEKSDAYHRYIKKTGLKDYLKISGSMGAFLLKQEDGYLCHFLALSLWSDKEAIEKFAGNDIQKAKYYPEDEAYLINREPFVEHYEILEGSSSFDTATLAEKFRTEFFFRRPMMFYK
jgi:hypothetical protein